MKDPVKTVSKICSVILSCIVTFNISILSTDTTSSEDFMQNFNRINTARYANIESVEKVSSKGGTKTSEFAPKKGKPQKPVEDPEDDKGEVGDMPTVSDHNHIAYKQNDYSGKRISTGATISGEGCGWCSLTCAMAYLNPSQCASITPADWLNIMPNDVKGNWGSGGMGVGGPSAWVHIVDSMGDYGHYKIIESNTAYQRNSPLHIDVLRKYAGDPDKCVVLSCTSGLFTKGGHIILCTDIVEENGVIYAHISDSSRRAANRIGIDWGLNSYYNYPIYSNGQYITSCAGFEYEWKCSWVIQRTN